MKRFLQALMLFAVGASLSAAQLTDYGTMDAAKVHLRKAEEQKQSARIEEFDGVKALRIDWDNSLAKHFEFSTTDKPKFPGFLEAKIRVKVYISKDNQARNFNLRIADRDGEIFQFTKSIPSGMSGWNEFVYDVNSAKPKAFPWGGGAKANKQIDFPATLSGFALDFKSKEGVGFIALGVAEIDVISSNQPLRPQLDTGSPVRVLTPKDEVALVLNNEMIAPVTGKLEFRVSDAYGTELSKDAVDVKLDGQAVKRIAIAKPAKFGVYYVDVNYQEAGDGKKPFEKRFSFSYMIPAGPTEGFSNGFLFGVCSHPGGKSRNLELEAMAAGLCGAKMMRTDIYWERIQPKPDVWNFSRMDDVIDEFGKNGIEVQGIYCYLPQWATAKEWKPLNPKGKGKSRPDYELWRTFIAKTAERYRGKMRYVEVWNEPDLLGFANFSATEYINMMKIAYTETKKNDPEMKVLTGGFAGMPPATSTARQVEPDLIPRTLTEGKGFYDVFAFHGHGPFSGYRTQIEKLIKMCEDLKVETPWFANETAISSIYVGELTQATTLFQKLLYSWARGSIGYNWYDLRNDGFDPQENEHNFGLITNDFYPKAAYGAYNMLASVFRDAKYLKDADLGDSATGFFFRAADGAVLLPCWSDGMVQGDRLVMLSGIQGKVSVIDIFGNEETLAPKNGALVVRVGNMPSTLRFADQKDLPSVHGDFLRQDGELIFRPGKTREYRLELQNPTDRELVFQLGFGLPDGVTLDKSPEAIKVEAGKTQDVKLEFIVAPEFRSYHGLRKSIELTVAIGDLWKGVLLLPVHSVTVLEKQLREQPDFLLNRAEQVRVLAPNSPQTTHLFWKGVDDMSAEVRLGHDAGNLLLKIDVKDDVFFQPFSGANAFEGDNIQIAMKLPGQKGMWEIGLTRLADGKSEVFLWIAPDKFDPAKVAKQVSLETSRDENTKITSYTAKIPFDAIGLKEAARKNGFRFNLLVNDNDGEMRESYISISPGIGESKTPEFYPVILFE